MDSPISILQPTFFFTISWAKHRRHYPARRDRVTDFNGCWEVGGSRSKTHVRLLVSEWHLQIWLYVFCCSGERPRKGGERFAKGLNTTIYTKYTHENMIIIPCIDFAAARKSAQGSRKGGVRTVLGYHNFEQPPYMCIQDYMDVCPSNDNVHRF